MSISSFPSFDTDDESRDFIHSRNVSIDVLRELRMIHKRSLNGDLITYRSLFDSISNDSKNSNDLKDLNDSKDSNDSIDYLIFQNLVFFLMIQIISMVRTN